MGFRIEPRFPECCDCRFYSPRKFLARCLGCGAGEYFEERTEAHELTENEAMDLYRKMDRENDETH